jgi:Fic family protein
LARVRGSAGKEDKNAREVLGNVAAMREAIRLGATAERVTPDAIASIHRALIRDAIDGKGRAYGGMIRQEQNWIGGNDYNPLGAAFVPPPPEEVEGLLEDLSEFIERTDLQPIAQAAIAHAQFETIHPFLDGNGRTGRALVYSILRRRGELSEYVPPISLVLGGAPRTYVNALTAYREGQPETIVELFADATSRACVEAERLGERVAELREQWEERAGKLRSHATARRLLDVLPSSPVITVASGAELTGRSLRTTGVGLEQLAELGILKPLNARKWGRGWESAELFALVEDFEKRVSATQRDPAEPS